MGYFFRRAALLAVMAVIFGWITDHALRKEYALHPPKRSSVLITGASSGIGRAAAKALVSQGFIVYAGVRSSEAQQELVEELGGRVRPLLLDVNNPAHIESAYKIITESAQTGGGQLVALVNNAGTTYKRPLETALIEGVRSIFDVNVIGLLAVTQRFLPLLRRSRGRIVNIGSVQGIISMPMQGVYAATKHALEAMSDTLRQELEPHGVSVSMVNPGYVNTGIRGKGSPIESNSSLTVVEREVYYDRFVSMWRKDAKLSLLSPPCCSQTDEAIVHAITAAYPRTRYYPFTAAVALGDCFPAWLAAIIIRSFSLHPTLDRLKDIVVANFF